MKILAVLLFAVTCHSAYCQSLKEKIEHDTIDATFPGGLETLYRRLGSQIKYPDDARQRGIEGRVFVGFEIDSLGSVDPFLVKTLRGVDPVLDSEAERVLVSLNMKWYPARYLGKPIAQKMVLPVMFKLSHETENQFKPASDARLPDRFRHPIHSTVIRKSHTSEDPNWKVTADPLQKEKIGTISPGDTVSVLGWGPFTFYVENTTVAGYVSWKSLTPNEKLDSLSRIIRRHSPELDSALTYEEFIDSTKRSGSFVQLLPDRKLVTVYDCVTANLNVFVPENESAKTRFANLSKFAEDFSDRCKESDQFRFTSIPISEIIGEYEEFGTANYVRYTIMRVAFCPQQPGTLTLPKVQIEMLKEDAAYKFQVPLQLVSEPIKVQVMPSPDTDKTSQVVGNFSVIESLSDSSVAVNRSVEYRLTIQGFGRTAAIRAPVLAIDNANIRLLHVDSNEDIANGQYLSSKQFTYTIIFTKPGIYQPGKGIVWHWYDPVQKKRVDFRFTKNITVTGVKEQGDFAPGATRAIVALDISGSMTRIRDYQPSRAGAALKAISATTSTKQECLTQLLLFGSSSVFVEGFHSTCSAPSNLNDYSDIQKGGTDLMGALTICIDALSVHGPRTEKRKVILISDGDANSGTISLLETLQWAKEANVAIYCIGVGHAEPVEFDDGGSKYRVADTFSDELLKDLALRTGGEYYQAGDENALQKALTMAMNDF